MLQAALNSRRLRRQTFALPLRNDADGIDCGAYILDELTVHQLLVGDIQPLADNMWTVEREDFEHDLMYVVGVRQETIKKIGHRLSFSVTGIPVIETERRHANATADQDRFMFYGKLQRRTGSEGSRGVEGLSGSPVFGVRFDGPDEVTYTLLGIQSGTFGQDNVTIARAPLFLGAVKRTLETIVAKTSEARSRVSD